MTDLEGQPLRKTYAPRGYVKLTPLSVPPEWARAVESEAVRRAQSGADIRKEALREWLERHGLIPGRSTGKGAGNAR